MSDSEDRAVSATGAQQPDDPAPSVASAHIGAAIGVLAGGVLMASPVSWYSVPVAAAGMLGFGYLAYRNERRQLNRGEANAQ